MPGTTRSGGDRVANGDDTFPRDGLPSRPMGLSKPETEYWTQLLSQLPNELLRRVDVHQLRSLCECLATRDGLVKLLRDNPLDKDVFSHYMRTIQMIAKLSPVFGLGPIDRRRMKIAAPPDDNEDEWS
jgi:hypothetical protein